MSNTVTLLGLGYEGLDIVSTTVEAYQNTRMSEKIQTVAVDCCVPTINLFKNRGFDRIIKWGYPCEKNEGGQSLSKGLGLVNYEDAKKEYELATVDRAALNEIISGSSYMFVVAALDGGCQSFMAAKICELCQEMGKECDLYAVLPLRGVSVSYDNNARSALAVIHGVDYCKFTPHIFDSEDYVPKDGGGKILVETAVAVKDAILSDMADKLKEHIYRSGIFSIGKLADEAVELYERTVSYPSEYHLLKIYAKKNGDDMNSILRDGMDEVIFVVDITHDGMDFTECAKEVQAMGLKIQAFLIHASETEKIYDNYREIPDCKLYDYAEAIERIRGQFGVGEADARADIIRELSLIIRQITN